MIEDTNMVDSACKAAVSEIIDVISHPLFRPFIQFDIDIDTDMRIKFYSTFSADLTWLVATTMPYVSSLDLSGNVIFHVTYMCPVYFVYCMWHWGVVGVALFNQGAPYFVKSRCDTESTIWPFTVYFLAKGLMLTYMHTRYTHTRF